MRRPQVRCLVPSPLLLNYFRFFSARSGINEVALQINVASSLKEKKKKRERVRGRDKRRERKKRVLKKRKSFDDDDDVNVPLVSSPKRKPCLSNAVILRWRTVSPKEKLRAFDRSPSFFPAVLSFRVANQKKNYTEQKSRKSTINLGKGRATVETRMKNEETACEHSILYIY